jgi:hypothetical protein
MKFASFCARLLGRAMPLLVAAILLSPSLAAAQDGLYDAGSTDGNFNNPLNWAPNGVPTGTATISSFTQQSLIFSGFTTLGAIDYDGGTSFRSPASTLTLGPALSVTFTGTGMSVSGAATFIVNGTVFGNVTTNGAASGPVGTLAGNGTINGTVTNSGAISPGSSTNAFGTLAINGSFVNSGGTFNVNVGSAGQSNLLAVTGAPSITGAGGVSVHLTDGGAVQSYTILTATGGVTGTFENVGTDQGFFRPTLVYGANSIT